MDWLDTAREASETMRLAAMNLEWLADRMLHMFGKTDAVRMLYTRASELQAMSTKLLNATTEKCVADFKQAEEQSGLLLKAALAGAFMKGVRCDDSGTRESAGGA